MFFQLIAKRYENRPVIITTNQPFSKWGEVFGDNTILEIYQKITRRNAKNLQKRLTFTTLEYKRLN